ncbi:MAG: hypothetical protein QOE70_4364 [Chthoniobacter sp.]|jgi:hypothetical protein|nr:hypothetical protein [Chthoniobacter sp.]
MSTDLATRDSLELAERVRPLLEAAKETYAEIVSAEQVLRLKRDELLMLAFRLGGILVRIKDAIGHGRWLFWLGGNWPDLGERNSQRCMTLFRENDAKSVDSTDLNAESIRKFLWGYIPAKERPELPGDQRITPTPHPLTFVNQFFKWDQQCKIGLATAPEPDVLRHDLEPVVRRIIEIGGREWVAGLLM